MANSINTHLRQHNMNFENRIQKPNLSLNILLLNDLLHNEFQNKSNLKMII